VRGGEQSVRPLNPRSLDGREKLLVNTNDAEIQAMLYQHLPLYEHIGMTVESSQDGIYRCRLPLEARNSNHINTVHAALQWATAEALGGVLIIDTFGSSCFAKVFVAVKSASIEFVRPARTAIIAEAIPDPQELQRIKALVDAGKEAQFSLGVTIRSADGEAVARMSANYIARPKRAAVSNPRFGA
jgi:acyl-coenzyme A thioesterase PaaI-like protein